MWINVTWSFNHKKHPHYRIMWAFCATNQTLTGWQSLQLPRMKLSSIKCSSFQFQTGFSTMSTATKPLYYYKARGGIFQESYEIHSIAQSILKIPYSEFERNATTQSHLSI